MIEQRRKPAMQKIHMEGGTYQDIIAYEGEHLIMHDDVICSGNLDISAGATLEVKGKLIFTSSAPRML